jgi:hypothetical protein
VILRIPLNTDPQQSQRLAELHAAFAAGCNAITPVVQQTRVWNRVALHHLVYKKLRDAFPALGSQMVCNVIYSVSRTSRVLFQHPDSPFNVTQRADKPLPLLRFAESCPVYFDRHTLSLKKGTLSMFTLDGRMHFELTLRPEDEEAFHQRKLREIVLSRSTDNRFVLQFTFAEPGSEDTAAAEDNPEVPEYILIEEAS